MTPPSPITEAQVDAAVEAQCRRQWAPHELPLDPDLLATVRETARLMLEAAAREPGLPLTPPAPAAGWNAEAMREAAAKRLVILESPYAGDIEANTRYARACLRDSLLRGEAPIASHLLYTQPGVLDDMIGEERQLGIDAGLAWKTIATASVAYTDRGISRGMQYGIDAATAAGLPVEYRRLSTEALPLPPAQPPAVGDEAGAYRAFELAGPLDVRTGNGMWAIDTATVPMRPVARCLGKDDAQMIVTALNGGAALSSIPAPEIEALRKVVTVELERDEWNHRVATHLRSFLARLQSPTPAGEADHG